ncbi:hypothetical protein BLNAU_19851 [Blattamonas nauphoetae]|uniref:Uncharacterized protein n=1 Tax=Blattamonas nauphoetae TaxID=2049346 RepID=A0ABQ9X094_9EUKA|nr:hypothetical protein BLNAU_19851 [Blattamonas nauphoetae]
MSDLLFSFESSSPRTLIERAQHALAANSQLCVPIGRNRPGECWTLYGACGRLNLKEMTIDTAIEELETGMFQPEAVVNSRVWQTIPIVIREYDVQEERNIHKMERLIRALLQILNECLSRDIRIINRRILHSSLSTLAQSPTLPKKIRVGVTQCLTSLDSIEDDHFVLVGADEFNSPSTKPAKIYKTETW